MGFGGNPVKNLQNKTYADMATAATTAQDNILQPGGIGQFGDATIFNPTNPAAANATNNAGAFFANLFGSQKNPYASLGMQGLSGQAGNAISSFLGQQNPQTQTFNQGIMNFLQGGAPGGISATDSNFNVNANPFEMSSLFDPSQGLLSQGQGNLSSLFGQGLGLGGGIGQGQGALGLPGSFDAFSNNGALGAGQQLINALGPMRQQQQQSALGNLSNSIGNRFSTAFVGQGQDLLSQFGQQNAAQDASILNQAQGLNLQQAMANQGAGLQGAGILSDFFQGNANIGTNQALANLQGQLGAGSLLGTFGQNAFGNSLAQGQYGQGVNAQNFGQNLQSSMFGLGQNNQNFQNQLASSQFNANQGQNYLQNLLAASGNAFNQGQGQFQNLLNAGGFGMAQTQQGLDPWLQLLGLGTQFAQPNPLELAIQQQSGGGGGLGGFLGTLAGSFLGPVGAAGGGALGQSLFG